MARAAIRVAYRARDAPSDLSSPQRIEFITSPCSQQSWERAEDSAPLDGAGRRHNHHEVLAQRDRRALAYWVRPIWAGLS
jgi:hypothetical protein